MVTLRVLTLNCQRGHRRANLQAYLWSVLEKKTVDFLLLQEADAQVRHALSTVGLRRFGYSILTAEYPGMGETAQLAIVHKSKHTVACAGFVPFSELRVKRNMTWGALFAHFLVDGQRMLVCTLHLDPGQHAVRRQVEVRQVKQALRAQKCPLTILGGDFNFAIPGELAYVTRTLAPDFRLATRYATHSHDSGLVEENYLGNKLLKRLAVTTGIRFKTKIDHIYVASATSRWYGTRVHDVLVSDHRPVELLIE